MVRGDLSSKTSSCEVEDHPFSKKEWGDLGVKILAAKDKVLYGWGWHFVTEDYVLWKMDNQNYVVKKAG